MKLVFEVHTYSPEQNKAFISKGDKLIELNIGSQKSKLTKNHVENTRLIRSIFSKPKSRKGVKVTFEYENSENNKHFSGIVGSNTQLLEQLKKAKEVYNNSINVKVLPYFA